MPSRREGWSESCDAKPNQKSKHKYGLPVQTEFHHLKGFTSIALQAKNHGKEKCEILQQAVYGNADSLEPSEVTAEVMEKHNRNNFRYFPQGAKHIIVNTAGGWRRGCSPWLR